MRAQKLWRDTPSSTLCVFCAYHFRSVGRGGNVQHRLLQTSTKDATQPQVASHHDLEPAPWQRKDKTSSTSKPGPVPSWGRPAFGSVGSTTSSSGRPTFGSGKIELSPEELRARQSLEKIAEQQGRRVVQIASGPGPQSTRAGRPEPPAVQDRPVLKARDQAQQLYAQRREEKEESPVRPFSVVRRISDRSAAEPRQKPVVSRSDTPYEGSTWSQLRRKTVQLAEPRKTIDDNIKHSTEDSANREHSRRTINYTSFGTQKSRNAQERPAQYTRTAVTQDTTEASQSTEQSRIQGSGGFRARRSPLIDVVNSRDSLRPENRREDEPVSAVQSSKDRRDSSSRDLRDPAIDIQPARHEREAKRSGRSKDESARHSRSNDVPKGRDRDKSKRRQQFVSEYDEDDEEAELAILRAELKKQKKRDKAAKKAASLIPIMLPEYISVANLAAALRVRFDNFVFKMEELGYEEMSPGHVLNSENAGLIAMEYGYEPIIDRGETEDLKARPPPEHTSTLPPRSPVVTIMGHVDHGKTTLLDHLRKSSVAASEHGGITQHIGAFSVPMPSGKVVTFLDTPGHAAFLSMRQRGANVTDIVVLVVAADDSVKPQTIEAINHAKNAKVPIIVAINKIDKEDANIERVKQDLARHGVDVEDFGGETQVVCVSGKTGQGMDQLEETLVAQSEIMDMRAEVDGPAEGWILEASIKSMGKVATVLVRRGTMRTGDFIVAGKTWARIRCLRNEAGIEIDAAGPGTPVEIDGWKDQPLAGDEVLQASSEAKAKSAIDYRLEKEERERMAEDMEAINETRKTEQERRTDEKRRAADEAAGEAEEALSALPKAESDDGPKPIYFIVKGDVSGSVEAVVDSIAAIGNNEVRPHILRSGVGQLAEFDVDYAAASEGILVNFNTTVEANIASMAEKAKVVILDHNIIYRLVDDVKAKLSEYLTPLLTQRVLGEAEIAQVFDITVKGRTHKPVAGCKIRNGVVSRAAKVRVLRGVEKVFDGTLASLKNVKKDVAEVRKGGECGMGFEDWDDFEVGDQIQSYEVKEEKRYL